MLNWLSTTVEILKNYIVDLAFDSQLIIDIKKILYLTKRQKTSMKTQKFILSTIRHVKFSTKMCVENFNHEKLVDKTKNIISKSRMNSWWKRWFSNQYQRDFDSHFHEQCKNNNYELWTTKIFTKLFRKKCVFI